MYPALEGSSSAIKKPSRHTSMVVEGWVLTQVRTESTPPETEQVRSAGGYGTVTSQAMVFDS